MKPLIDRAGSLPIATRRAALRLLAAGATLLGGAAVAEEEEKVLTEDAVLRDPEIPPLGNAKGDIAIVEWFDYQCPYCRKIAPDLTQVIKDDGKVRLVLKDWPILGDVSKVAARMALAARYQDKFQAAHEAMIGLTTKLTEPKIREVLEGAGLDIDRLNRDLTANAAGIDALLVRNNIQAEAFGFQGTPSFIVGKFRVPGILTKEQFAQAIADARKAKMAR